MPPEVMGGVGQGAGATVMETPNPFTYDDSASAVQGKVMTMGFKNPDGSPMKIADTEKPIDIWMPGMRNIYWVLFHIKNFLCFTLSSTLSFNIMNCITCYLYNISQSAFII